MTRRSTVILALCIALLLLFPLGLMTGDVALSAQQVADAILHPAPGSMPHFIIMETRLPALVTAIMCGASLAVAGILMQTIFANPLAGPSIMGISGGASLGAAVMVVTSLGYTLLGGMAAVVGALIGAALVIVLLLLFSMFVRSGEVLLIVGILLGYLTSALITLLSFYATEHGVHNIVMWSMGTFARCNMQELALPFTLCTLLCAAAMLYSKTLNAMLFGTRYAQSVGISIRQARTGILVLAGALTAVVTAWCGPVGFIGLVAPHLARMSMATSDHRATIPGSALFGALMALGCQIISVSPAIGGSALAINAITPVIGVPVIIYVLVCKRKILYFS